MALKPMNCPAHILIFRQGIKSYRDLPIRMAEFGCCHRNEPHGALHGILRVRQFTQDDAHIFCREDQIVEETRRLLRPARYDLSRSRLRRLCDQARASARETASAATRCGTGPKPTCARRSARRPRRARIWLGGAARRRRLLFAQARIPPDRCDRPDLAGRHAPARLCHARAARRLLHRRGRRKARPVMLHRAIIGTFERFLGILIEHHAGRFPLWLAPVQAVVATIVSDADDYAREVAETLIADGPARRKPICATRRSTTRCASTASPRSLTCSSSASARRRKTDRGAAPARGRRAPGDRWPGRLDRKARHRGAAARSSRDPIGNSISARASFNRRAFSLGDALVHAITEKPTYVPLSPGDPPRRRSTAPASTNSLPCPRCG